MILISCLCHPGRNNYGTVVFSKLCKVRIDLRFIAVVVAEGHPDSREHQSQPVDNDCHEECGRTEHTKAAAPSGEIERYTATIPIIRVHIPTAMQKTIVETASFSASLADAFCMIFSFLKDYGYYPGFCSLTNNGNRYTYACLVSSLLRYSRR